jgi:hypothetical protein
MFAKTQDKLMGCEQLNIDQYNYLYYLQEKEKLSPSERAKLTRFFTEYKPRRIKPK